jgi:short-subunit dehydrogenase
MNTSRKSALITGASGGIGLDLARLFARDGYRVILVARSEAKLREHAAALGGDYVVADLTNPDAPAEIYSKTGDVDVLVNNAGFGTYGPFADSDPAREIEMIQVNVAALTHLTRLFLPGMVRKRSGAIMNVASTAAFQPGPLMAVYYATKAYVLSFSEAIADELRHSGVTVTALCPGPTRTGFVDVAKMGESGLFKRLKPMTSAEVARIGYEGMRSGKRVVVTGVMNKLVAQSVRVSPRRVVTTIVRKMQERV